MMRRLILAGMLALAFVRVEKAQDVGIVGMPLAYECSGAKEKTQVHFRIRQISEKTFGWTDFAFPNVGEVVHKGNWHDANFYSKSGTRSYVEQLLVTSTKIVYDAQVKDEDTIGHFRTEIDRASNTFAWRYSTYSKHIETPHDELSGTCTLEAQ